MNCTYNGNYLPLGMRITNVVTMASKKQNKGGRTPGSKNIKKDTEKKVKKNAEKRVYQHTLNGVFIAEFRSGTIAANETGIHLSSIGRNCRGITKKSKGYIWSFKRLDCNE